MKIIVQPRQAGKTYELIEWVKQGVRIDAYPGWSRVILTHTLDEAQRIRTREDIYYHQVFSVDEWRSGRIPSRFLVEIAVDNADLILAEYLNQYPAAITMTRDS